MDDHSPSPPVSYSFLLHFLCLCDYVTMLYEYTTILRCLLFHFLPSQVRRHPLLFSQTLTKCASIPFLFNMSTFLDSKSSYMYSNQKERRMGARNAVRGKVRRNSRTSWERGGGLWREKQSEKTLRLAITLWDRRKKRGPKQSSNSLEKRCERERPAFFPVYVWKFGVSVWGSMPTEVENNLLLLSSAFSGRLFYH